MCRKSFSKQRPVSCTVIDLRKSTHVKEFTGFRIRDKAKSQTILITDGAKSQPIQAKSHDIQIKVK